MGDILVHTDGGGETAAADDGDAGQLQKTLYGAVLAVLAVENWKGGVQPDSAEPRLGNHQQAVELPVRGDDGGGAAARVVVPGVRRDGVLGAVVEEPAAIPGDAQEDGLVLVAVQAGNHRVGGLEGHGVLRGAAAEEDTDVFFHQKRLPFCYL